MPALGEQFRSAREARGLSLSDVAEQIHIRSVYLNAIETEDWPSIGAPVYVRGFIRTYARFLGVDAESAVQLFNDTVPPERPAAPQLGAASIGERRGGLSPWAVLGVVVALALVAFVGWEYWQFQSGGTAVAIASSAPAAAGASAAAVPPVAAPAAVSPAASPSATPLPTPAPTKRPTGHSLALRFTQPSWVRVAVDGTTAVEGILPAGTTKTFTGHAADVRIGNAGGVLVSVDGAPPKTLGGDGDVVEQHYSL